MVVTEVTVVLAGKGISGIVDATARSDRVG
jgi:hypothetical protein